MRKSNFKKGIFLPTIMLVMGMLSAIMANAQALTISTTPASFSLQEGERCFGSNGGANSISIKATGGTAPYTYQWKKDGVVVASLGTLSAVSFNAVTTNDQGSYTCVVTDNAGASIESAEIVMTVTVAPSAPVFLAAIADMTVGEGNDVVLSTVALYWSPKGVCKWYKEDGTPVTGGSESYVGGRFAGPAYTLTKPAASISGNYYCTMTNSKGTTKSNVFKVTVTPATSAPTYTYIISPLVNLKDSTMFRLTILEGSTRTEDFLSVNGLGFTSVQWKKDGQPVATPSTTPTRYAVQDQPGRSWLGSDAGTYTLDLTNSAGTTTTIPIIVTIAPSVKPKFVTYTKDTTVTEADTMALYGSASGLGITYTWARQLEDGSIKGFTNQINTYSAFMSIADTGTSYCVARNAAGYDTVAIHVSMKRTQPLPLFYKINDQYDQGGSNLVSIRLIGELSETLTLLYIDGVAATKGGRDLYGLTITPGTGALPLGKHTFKFTNADGTLVLEKVIEIK